jgi:CBS domain-containing protein
VVVDAEGRPQGVVSTTDLLRERRDRDDTEVVDRSHGPMVRGMHELSLAGATAGDVMTPVPLAVHESDTVAHAAALMAFEGIHRVVVVGDDGRVVGVLASTDVLRWIGHRAGFLIPSSTCRRRAQD